jgi:hypothetical protein
VSDMSMWAAMYGISPEQMEAARQPKPPEYKDPALGVDPSGWAMPNCRSCTTSQECRWCLREYRCSVCLWPLMDDGWCSWCAGFEWQQSLKMLADDAD